MQIKKNIKKIAVVGVGVLMLGVTLFAAGCSSPAVTTMTLNITDYNELVKSNTQLSEELALEQSDKAKLASDLEQAQLDLGEYKATVTELDLKVQEFNAEILAEEGYFIDDLEFNSVFSEVISDKELTLFDGNVEFDGSEYDAEEVISVSGTPAINAEDYGSDVYLQLPEGSVSYGWSFENKIDLDDIDRETPLEFTFLGEDVKIVEWSGNELTLSKGMEISLNEGESYDFNGQKITVTYVDSHSVKVFVGEESKIIRVGQTVKINEVEVKVTNTNYQAYAGGVHSADLDIGAEVTKVIEDGDDYLDDDDLNHFVYVVEPHYLGIELSEDYTDLDEDFKPLAYGEYFTLPNDYAKIEFVGLDDVEYHQITFETDVKEGQDMMEIRGDFTKDLKDYDKVWVNTTGIYDTDLNLLDSQIMKIDGTESELHLLGGNVEVHDVELPLDLHSVMVERNDVSGTDETLRTVYGTIVKSPEDAIDDEKLVIQLPEEQVTAVVRIVK